MSITSIDKAAFFKAAFNFVSGRKTSITVLQNLHRSGFEAPLLINPVNDIPIGGVTTDGLSQ